MHPVLVVEPGGYFQSAKRSRFNYKIPGKNPDVVRREFGHLPEDGLRIDSSPTGKVRNIGFGPAVEVEVEFRPRLIRIGDEEFKIDSEKLKEARYSPAWNTEVTMQHVIAPGGETEISGLPVFITLDFNDRISHAEGVVEIKYKDLTSRVLATTQEFSYSPGEMEGRQVVRMTFGDILRIPYASHEALEVRE